MKTKTIALVLLTAALGVLLGCQTQKARQQEQAARQYQTAFHAVMADYADTTASEARRPMPPASLPRHAKEALLADQIDRTADTNALVTRRLSALTPPPSQTRVHAMIVDMFQTTAPEDRQWAAALRAGDRKTAARESDRIQQTIAQHTAALKTLGVRFPAWMQVVLKPQD